MGEIQNKSTVTVTHTQSQSCHNRFISEWTTFATHSSVLSQHTCCQDRRSQRPCGYLGPLWMEEWAKPWPWLTAELAEAFCQRGCIWHHITPAAVWDLGQAEVHCVARARAPPCTRPDYPAVSRLLFHRSGHTTPAFSHCEVVWEKHSSLDPEENNIRTSQTRACVLVQTGVTGLAAVSLQNQQWSFDSLRAERRWMCEWKNLSIHTLSTFSVFLLLLVFFLYLNYAERLGGAVNKKPVLTKGFPGVMQGKLSSSMLLFSRIGK